MPEDKDLIPNEEATPMTESGPNTPVEIASGKALHDQKVSQDSLLTDGNKEEATEEDYDPFDLEAVDNLNESKREE